MLPSIVTIPPNKRGEWQALLQRTFSMRWGREYLRRDFFLDYVTHDPHHRMGHLVGLTVGKQLVSTYQVFRRRMVIGTRSYQVEGIGNVGTDVRFQGQGYGTSLLRGYLRTRVQGDVALVYAREGGLYRRLGWRRLRHRVLIVERAAIAGLAQLRPLRSRRVTPDDLPALARIYSRFNRTEMLPHVVRSALYWARWVSWKVKAYHLTADLFLEGTRPVGYMFSRRLGPTMVIEEYGALPSARARVYHTMLAALAGPRRVATLQVMRPAGSLEQFLDTVPAKYEARRGFHETGHAVICNPSLRSWSQQLALWHVDHF